MAPLDPFEPLPRFSPGYLVAEEVSRMMRGKSTPLSDEDVHVSAAVMSQAAAAVTPIPAFLWKQAIKKTVRMLPPGFVTIVGILAGSQLPLLVWLNAQALYEFLMRFHLFETIDQLRALVG